jgi:hypothetical protein
METEDTASGNKRIAGHIGGIKKNQQCGKDEQILNTLDELAEETMRILKKKGISLTVDDFLKERER